jgi:hypothetical protein
MKYRHGTGSLQRTLTITPHGNLWLIERLFEISLNISAVSHFAEKCLKNNCIKTCMDEKNALPLHRF